MSSNRLRVLDKLQRSSRRGVSALDFPTGFRLSARIHELRREGKTIITDTSNTLAVYRLEQPSIAERHHASGLLAPCNISDSDLK